MSELPQEVWFYTREGARIGPVGFDALLAEARQGALNPRFDMVWTSGMAEWQPAGQIKGLFEQRTPPALPESLAPAADPYTPPQLETVEESMSRLEEWRGARRRSFLFATLVFPVLWSLVFAISADFLTRQFGPVIMGSIGGWVALVPVLVGVYYGLMRLVNLGMSRWWYLGNFVPLLNLWVGYRCFACPAGYAYHKQLDGVGVMLAIFYWLLMVACIIACVAIVAVLLGAVDSPALQAQLLELLRTIRDQAAKP